MSKEKRSFDDAFKRKKLDRIEVGDYYVDCNVYKILYQDIDITYRVRTSQNVDRKNSEKVVEDVIIPKKEVKFMVKSTQNFRCKNEEGSMKQLCRSATWFDNEEELTKTELIKLFSILSINEIWSAVFYKHDTNENWQKELVTKIQEMQENDAVKFVKKDFQTFGKITRELKGQKLSMTSDNNYYLVRDLEVYFDSLEEGCSVETSEGKSIRNLDVNTLQSLIFNGTKYILK